MQKRCFALGETGLEPHDPDRAVDHWVGHEGSFWFDLEGMEPSALEAFLERIGVDGLLRRRCLDLGDSAAVIALRHGTFIEMPVFADRACKTRTNVAALCLPNLLVTMHADPIEGSGYLVKAMTDMELEQISTSSIVCALLYAQCEVTARAARRLRVELLEHGARIDASIDASIDGLSEDDLERLKNQVLLTDAIAEEQDEVCALLPHAVGAGFTTEGLEGPLGLMTTTASATNRLVDRLDVRAENLHRRYQDVKQELLSRRLGMLTMLSAVFLPLTLLAGIWGMNFEHMPELDDPYAYPAALGLMALVGAAGVWFFRKHGWFD